MVSFPIILSDPGLNFNVTIFFSDNSKMILKIAVGLLRMAD